MKQINIATLARPEEVLAGAAARQVNGAGLNLICGVGGCRVALPAPVVYPAYGYPTVYGYGAYPAYVGAVSPFYGPVAPVPYVGNYFGVGNIFNGGYW